MRRLREDGDASASEVTKLRRPTVAAWALNVVARTHPAAVKDVLDAGERLRAAQREALRGDAGALRAATEDRRRAIATAAALVAEVLGDRAPAHAAAVSATLEAATVDDDVAHRLSAGRLDRERAGAAAGFGFGDLGDWTPPPKGAAKPRRTAAPPEPDQKRSPDRATKTVAGRAPKTKATQDEDDGLRAELERAVEEAKRRAAELHDAEAEVQRLKKALADATRLAREARTKANRAELDAEQVRQRVWEQGERRR